MSDQNRRKLLKSIAAGSGAVIAGRNLPESWTQPVVDSVMLPAHAQTSTLSYFGLNVDQLEEARLNSGSLLAKATNTFLPEARAGVGVRNTNTDWCVEVTGATAMVTVVNNHSDAKWSGSIPIDGTPVELPLVQDTCEDNRNVGGELYIDGYTLGDPTMTIRGTEVDWYVVLPLAAGGCGTLDPLGECNSEVD